ncbi:MAG: energy transducer TonB [Sphingomonas sp.]
MLATLTTPVIAQRAQRAMGPAPIDEPGSWVGPDDYPKDAIRANRQGRVMARLDVDATGHVTACRIATSSGTDSLNAKTCEILLVRAKFNPATDRRGRPIASTYSLPVRWVMPEDSGPKTVEVATAGADLDVEIAIGADGKIIRCRMITQIAPAPTGAADQCASMKPGTMWEVFTKDGKPTAVIVRQRFTRSVKIAPVP